MACFFPTWHEETNCTEVDASCTGWSMFAGEVPPVEIGTLRIVVDRAVGISAPASLPVVKLSYKESGEHFGGTLRAMEATPPRDGTYVWDHEISAPLTATVTAGHELSLLVFIKEGRRTSFHTHHESLAGHVLDVDVDAVLREQKDAWVERRLKLTPRGYLLTRLRFEATAAYAPADSDGGGPHLTVFERHVRERSPSRRDGVDEAALAESRREAAASSKLRGTRRSSSRASSSSSRGSSRSSLRSSLTMTSADGSSPTKAENVLFEVATTD